GFSMPGNWGGGLGQFGQNERENTGKWGNIDPKTRCEKSEESQAWRALQAVSAHTMMLLK
ncbi:hypothetical protein, partial [Aeromonas salmonicida]|uniref:hypothetical protein n=1 Tax=Aeromonas salmonicida TaxID=645 RepID=UPI002242209B